MKLLSRKKSGNDQFAAWVFLLPALLAFLIFKYYPILLGFFISFYEINIVELPGKFVGFSNYSRAFADPDFYAALRNNVEFWIIGLILNFWPPIILALLVNEVRKGKTFFRMTYFIPAVAPSIAILVLWKYIYSPDYGLANAILNYFHLPGLTWLNDVALVKWAMYLPGLIISGGMSMVIYMASLNEVPKEMYESAMIDGAGVAKRIWHITLPFIMPIVKVMFIMDLINRFNEAAVPLVYTGGGPVGETTTLILYALKSAMNNLDYSYAITLANIAFVIIFIITALQMKLTSREK